MGVGQTAAQLFGTQDIEMGAIDPTASFHEGVTEVQEILFIPGTPRDPLAAQIGVAALSGVITLEAIATDTLGDIELVLQRATYTVSGQTLALGPLHTSYRGDGTSTLADDVLPDNEGDTATFNFDVGADHEPLTWTIDEDAKRVRLDFDGTDTFGLIQEQAVEQLGTEITVTLIEDTLDTETPLPPPIDEPFVAGQPFSGTRFLDSISDRPAIGTQALGTRVVAEDTGEEQIVAEVGRAAQPASYTQASYTATNYVGAFPTLAPDFDRREFTSSDDSAFRGVLTADPATGSGGDYYININRGVFLAWDGSAWIEPADPNSVLPADHVLMITSQPTAPFAYTDDAQAIEQYFTGRTARATTTYLYLERTTIDFIQLTISATSTPPRPLVNDEWMFVFEGEDGHHLYRAGIAGSNLFWIPATALSQLGLPANHVWMTPAFIEGNLGLYADYEAAREYLEGLVYRSRYTYMYADRALVAVRTLTTRVDPVPSTIRKEWLHLAGLGLGPEQNEFGTASTTNRAAAEALRNTYTSASANATWLSQYNNNRTFLIRLLWNGGDALQRRNSAGTGWEDFTAAIAGPRGADGAQARFPVVIYRNAAATPTTPTGGNYVISTGVLTPPTGWSVLPSIPPSNQDTYESRDFINPAIDDDVVVLVWSAPVDSPVQRAIAAQVAAETARSEAQTAQAAAASSATSAASSATDAASSATDADTAQTGAETAQTGAETARAGSETAETNAETAQTGAEAALAGAETALASSGAALAFNDLWSGDIDITTANQWKAVGTTPVPSNATWLLWNGGKLSDDDDDGPAGLWTWINAAKWAGADRRYRRYDSRRRHRYAHGRLGGHEHRRRHP